MKKVTKPWHQWRCPHRGNVCVLLVSIFMIPNSLTTASDALKEYGKQSLFKTNKVLGMSLISNPVMNLEKNNIHFLNP